MGQNKGRLKVKIHITNNMCRIMGSVPLLEEIHEDFKIKVKGAFFSPAFRKRQWDGKKPWVTSTGNFNTGLLPKVLNYLKANEVEVELLDNREMMIAGKLPDSIGGLTLRGYQKESTQAVVDSTLFGIQWPRGILHEATNAGKNLIAAAIHETYEDGTTFFFVHRTLLYKQAIKEIGNLLGKSEVGMIGPGVVKISRFNICMIRSFGLKCHLAEVRKATANATKVIVDECHRAASKEYQKALSNFYNSPIRIGLSGTPDLKGDKNYLESMRAFFGEKLHHTSNMDLVEGGYSTRPIIRISLGEYRRKLPGDYKGEYDLVITKNKSRNRKVWSKVLKKANKGIYPIMVFTKYIEHAKRLYSQMPEEIRNNYSVGVIHSKVKNKEAILDKFKVGKIDILIATHLIHEGQNMPLIKYAINCGGSDSATVIVQWVGRMLRTHKTKKKVIIEDIFDLGTYLKRHSKHRVRYYKAEGFEVIEKYKEQAKKRSIRIY